jgi:hypothetical protein
MAGGRARGVDLPLRVRPVRARSTARNPHRRSSRDARAIGVLRARPLRRGRRHVGPDDQRRLRRIRRDLPSPLVPEGCPRSRGPARRAARSGRSVRAPCARRRAPRLRRLRRGAPLGLHRPSHAACAPERVSTRAPSPPRPPYSPAARYRAGPGAGGSTADRRGAPTAGARLARRAEACDVRMGRHPTRASRAREHRSFASHPHVVRTGGAGSRARRRAGRTSAPAAAQGRGDRRSALEPIKAYPEVELCARAQSAEMTRS